MCQIEAPGSPQPPSTSRLGFGNGQRPLVGTAGTASPSFPQRARTTHRALHRAPTRASPVPCAIAPPAAAPACASQPPSRPPVHLHPHTADSVEAPRSGASLAASRPGLCLGIEGQGAEREEAIGGHRAPRTYWTVGRPGRTCPPPSPPPGVQLSSCHSPGESSSIPPRAYVHPLRYMMQRSFEARLRLPIP